MRIGSNFLHENLHLVFFKFTKYPSGWVVPPEADGTLPTNAEISSDVKVTFPKPMRPSYGTILLMSI